MNDALRELAQHLSQYLFPLFPEENEPNARRAGRSLKFESIVKKIKANDLHATFGIENNETFLYQLTRELGNRFGEQPLLALARAAYAVTSGPRAAELDQIITRLEAEANRPPADLGLTDSKSNEAPNKKENATESQANIDGVDNESKAIETSASPITEKGSEHAFVGNPNRGKSPIQPTIVLVTVNEYETQAVLDEFVGAGNKLKNVTKGSVTYNDLGSHAGHQIIHTICEMGPGGVGGSQQRTRDAIDHWQPHAVIAIGIAFGLDDEKQKIGDVLVSTQIQDYELSRMNNDGTVTPRGDKPSSSDPLKNRIRQADTNQRRIGKDWPKVRFGLVLSGQKLVDNLDYRNSLKSLYSEAIGGEMEGVGVYVSAIAAKVDWIVIKAICDWGYNKNQEMKDEWQRLAAMNAAHVLKVSLALGTLYANDSGFHTTLTNRSLGGLNEIVPNRPEDESRHNISLMVDIDDTVATTASSGNSPIETSRQKKPPLQSDVTPGNASAPKTQRAINRKTASVIAAVEFTLDRPIAEFDETKFILAFTRVTGIQPSSVRISSIRPGSTIVELEGDLQVIKNALTTLKSASKEVEEFAVATGLVRIEWKIDSDFGQLTFEYKRKPGTKIPTRVREVSPKFAVAFTFAGEQRELVRSISSIVEDRLGRGKVFFDEWYEHYVAGEGADTKLRTIYGKNSELVVLGVSAAYGRKSWTLTEYEAVRARQMRLRSSPNAADKDQILPLRVGDGDVEGIEITAIVPDVRDRTPEATAQLIIDRLSLVAPDQVPSLHYGKTPRRGDPSSNASNTNPAGIAATTARTEVWRVWVNQKKIVQVAAIIVAAIIIKFLFFGNSAATTITNATSLQNVVDSLANGLAVAHPTGNGTPDAIPIERSIREIKGPVYEKWDLHINTVGLASEVLPDHPPFVSGLVTGTAQDFNGNERQFQFSVIAVPRDKNIDVTQYKDRDLAIRGKVNRVIADNDPILIIMLDCDFKLSK